MRDEKMYEELAHRLRAQHETFKKWQRKIMNEPESEEKYAKFEIMQKVVDRSAEVVNWWNNAEAKAVRKEKHQQELARAEQKKRQHEKALMAIQEEEMLRRESGRDLRPGPVESQYNLRCRHHCMISKNFAHAEVEHRCDIGMDMAFCSNRCAYATNMVGSSRAYETPYSSYYREY